MFSDKQKQQIGNNSYAIQAGNNVNVSGMSFSEVRELFNILFENQFPKLKDVAYAAAQENAKDFEERVVSDLTKNVDRLIIDKFCDPDVQATLTEALKSSARKGKKANMDVLSQLLVERVSNNNDDFRDIVLTEAVTVVPKLTQQQISLITIVFLLKNVEIKDPVNGVRLDLLERNFRSFESMYTDGFNLSQAQIYHIQYAGACSWNTFLGIDVEDYFMNKYPTDIKDKSAYISNLKLVAPHVSAFLEKFSKSNYQGIELTSVGQAIALAVISRYVGRLDYKIWLK
ncbi:hypothetical protein G3J33_003114 [Salmonella enterica]|nr:hypothetical protein [Salmonella enterica]ECK2042929.1 hypothetical protein [Salmonella enterica subsp. enterica]EDP2031060.1 hypothetical protein [Salmonella enterica subsp. enterica serovar Carrau]SUH64999.1 Uncharacterised protein [Salmonella enterica subsp. enterica serovar Madelia]EAM1857825.1 hypothetical protein [Salmonella enterica]